tara:strand:+ start:9555 stop:9746 length:192 start_codon:yes stop_codon:yes gene_type:complete
MLVKLTRPYGQNGSGDIIEMEIGTARHLIKQGRAVLASTQESMKAIKGEHNKMVTQYDNKKRP